MTDPVRPEVASLVLWRDGRCVAPKLDRQADPCRGRTTLDHVRSKPFVGAPVEKRGQDRRHRYRAPSDDRHLVAVCEHHHLDGWATSHRAELREYLGL